MPTASQGRDSPEFTFRGRVKHSDRYKSAFSWAQWDAAQAKTCFFALLPWLLNAMQGASISHRTKQRSSHGRLDSGYRRHPGALTRIGGARRQHTRPFAWVAAEVDAESAVAGHRTTALHLQG